MTFYPAASASYQKAWIEKYPKKYAATLAVQKAIAAGALVRLPCEVCGATRRIHGHHPDYDKPLSVMWLCRTHHLGWHQANGPGANGGEPLTKRTIAEESVRDTLEATGGLWSALAMDSLETRIRADMEREFGFVPQEQIDLRDLRCSADSVGCCRAIEIDPSDSDGLTLEEIALGESVSREYIRQIEARALGRLRRAAKAAFRKDIQLGLLQKPSDVAMSRCDVDRTEAA